MFDVHQAKRENDWSVCAQRREITVFVPLPLPAKKKKKTGEKYREKLDVDKGEMKVD